MERRPEPELMDLPDEARVYARANFAHVNQAFVETLLGHVGDLQNVNAVDLGTGPGAIPILIAKERPSWQITAVDAAKAMLMIAQVGVKMQKLSDRVKVHLGDVKATGLPGGSFNVIFCNSVLHHMPEPLPLWQEIKRLAAPGAIVFLRDLHRPDSDEAALKLVEHHAGAEPKLLQDEFHRSLLAAFRVDEVRKQLDETGLSTLKVERVPDRHLDVFGKL